ncbi:MAG: hypothetical protein DHS20C15_27870 [Planctomycetota bacterium]|nr:MAG: hypothetical protein DHS20C15_27870 [Planctomycetota bacterium]
MSRTRVLVASADAGLRRHFELVCGERDYEYIIAESDEQVHKAHDSMHPSLVVVDLDGPGRDGVRLLRALAERHCNVPVVISGSCDVRTMAAAQRVGSKHGLCMAKPLYERNNARSIGRCMLDALSVNDHEITAEDLQRALDENQFELNYQPLVDLSTESVHGCEVLLRWDHPVFGPISPEKVIPFAEQHKLIGPLTEWIVRNALEQYTQWSRQGWNFRIAINVEADGLRDAMFADRIVAIVHETGVSPDRVILEVTESQTITEEVEVLETLTRLRLTGIELAIDDFGTGYSSLGRLHQLPFTELKIDKSFVIDAESDPNCEVIVRAISELGHQLGMLVVAEGVASREAWEFVQTLKCDVAQGFFISRGMPAAEFTNWLYRWGVTHSVNGRELGQAGQPHREPQHEPAKPSGAELPFTPQQALHDQTSLSVGPPRPMQQHDGEESPRPQVG